MTLFRALAPAILMTLPLSAWADPYCADLWFTRNALLDRAGQCFDTTLGRTLFDNAECVGAADPDVATARDVTEIAAWETRAGCAVDTGLRTLDLPDLSFRQRMRDLPLRDETESACLGWRGPRVLLHSGWDRNARITGSIEAGDHVLSSHMSAPSAAGPGWSYVTVTRPGGDGGILAAGWTQTDTFSACDATAG